MMHSSFLPGAMTDILDLDGWNEHWSGLGAPPPAEAVHADLLKRYAERHRAYHTRTHLSDCLSLLQETVPLCERPDEVALALWFHDAVYRTHRRDNEEKSAELLVKTASAAGVAADAVDRMRGLVLATRHAVIPDGRDAQVLVDIDLAILGASSERYDRFEEQIRTEYKWVPQPLYRIERSKILADFLSRTKIYSMEVFETRFENQARANLRRAIDKLRGR